MTRAASCAHPESCSRRSCAITWSRARTGSGGIGTAQSAVVAAYGEMAREPTLFPRPVPTLVVLGEAVVRPV